ncbi:MAG TPA: adenine deaminase [Anaerolineales bacterium]|nr:adenine deaminase [Anaerolineales bacterium]
MQNRLPWHEVTKTLVDVAMGREPADLVIRNGQWVCVQSGELIPHTDLAIKNGRFAYVGPDASHTIGESTEVVDAAGRYLAPGFLDAHMHVESGMLTVTEFVRAVAPFGTTGMFIDPHEIANVFGLRGVRLMADEAAVQPVHVWVQMPSCAPSAPGLETPGATIGPAEVEEAMQWGGIVGLGEMMNCPGVIAADEQMHAEMGATRQMNKVIGGHYASPDLGLPFHGYVAGGAEDDHEGTRMEDAVARVRQGMKVMLRYGSAWHDVAEGVRAITEMGLDARHFILCTDDCHSATLVNDGHVNRAVQQAIKHGVAPMTAYQMTTLNAAEHFGLAREVGQIAPGRYADVLVLEDWTTAVPELVFARGRLVARQGELLLEAPRFEYPSWATESVHLQRPLTAADFDLPAPAGAKQVAAHVIGVIENQAPTRHLIVDMPVIDGLVKTDIKKDLAKIALVERHAATGQVQVGMVQGFGFDSACALASTVAHDSHHLLVVGTREADMALAVNHLAKIGGGQVVVKDGEVIGEVALPIAGLMSNAAAETVARQAETILAGFRACGCSLNNPNMQLSLLALVVIPELRISDLGLVDVTRFEIVPVLETKPA